MGRLATTFAIHEYSGNMAGKAGPVISPKVTTQSADKFNRVLYSYDEDGFASANDNRNGTV